MIFDRRSFFSLLKHLPQKGLPHNEQQNFAFELHLEHIDSNSKIILTNNNHKNLTSEEY